MKVLLYVLLLTISAKVNANAACFASDDIKALIKTANDLKECFDTDDNDCEIDKMSIGEQILMNGKRLIPKDRTADDGFLDGATGVVNVNFDGKLVGNGSGQKISRCHVLTSAHIMYSEGSIPVEFEDFSIAFYSGQTCNPEAPFKRKARARVVFNMKSFNAEDFKCQGSRPDGSCLTRQFSGHSDLVILRLEDSDVDKSDHQHYSLNTADPSSFESGQRITCHGFPGYNIHLKLEEPRANMLLWMQENAKMFGDKSGTVFRGVATNAIAYPGMSGGGCVIPQKPRQLVGLVASPYSTDARSAINVSTSTLVSSRANYLSGFHKLAARYLLATGKNISDIASECK